MTNVQKTVTVRCNTDWTATATYDGINPEDVTFTRSGVANTTEGSDNFSYKFASGKYGKVTLKFSPKTTGLFSSVEKTIKSIPAQYPAYPGVIGYDPKTEALNLNGIGYMVFFKYGSIIAMYAGVDGEVWKTDGSQIAFNPTDISIGAYNSFPTPVQTNRSTVGNVSIDQTFHRKVINSQNGNGDPCRFIKSDGSGITAAEVKTKVSGGTVPDLAYWRLPTKDESSKFTLASSSWEQVAATAAGDATPRNGRTFTALNEFTYGNFLPAVGGRDDTEGKAYIAGTTGLYWSSTPVNSTGAYLLRFSATAVDWNNNLNSQASSYLVRCVRQ